MSNQTKTEEANPTSKGTEIPVEGTPTTAEATAESEEGTLGKLQADLDRFKDLALRSQADLDNYRKRAARDKEEAIKYANASLLERLIPVLDNFELGLMAAKAEGEKSPIYAGMQMVLKQMTDFLSESGVTAINAEGSPFDPNRHEALSQEPSDTVPEGTVLRQLRKGYMLRDRLLRPANVIVSKGKA